MGALREERHHPESPEGQQEAVLVEALDIYCERNEQYHDAWRHSGWRGALFDLRKKVERAWKHLFNAPVSDGPEYDVDELIDVINYAVFAIRAIREGNRDGKGGWW